MRRINLFHQGTRLTEQATPPAPTTEDWFWGRSSTTGSEEDYFWRRLSDNWSMKDVLPGTYLEIHNQCYEAYNANPLANAVVEMGVNFCLGDGLQIDANHKKVQALLDTFWNDDDNHMPIRQFEIATELSLYGEIFVRFFVNPYNGHVKVGLLDPSLVDQIECDPDNIEKQLRVHRRTFGPSATAPTTGLSLDDDKAMEGAWYSIPDEIMHFAVNKVSNAKRGKSDLATLLPWLRRYKDWLIDRVRINKYKAAFLWDVKLTGADRKIVEQKMMEYSRPPEPGSVLVHNESEEWSAVQPRIDATTVAADGHAIKMMVAIGAGIPEHYLSEGGDVNRATAAEMDLPTLKRYQRRQDYIEIVFRALLDRVILEAIDAGQLPRTIDTSYNIIFPTLTVEDSQTIGMAAYRMSQGLQTARQMGIISAETASKIFFETCRTEIDHNEEWDRIEQEGQVPGEPPAATAGATSSGTGAKSTFDPKVRPTPIRTPSKGVDQSGTRSYSKTSVPSSSPVLQPQGNLAPSDGSLPGVPRVPALGPRRR